MLPPAPLPSALEMHAVTKRFGTTLALDHVDFALAPGEIHALLGENGAGKSTLMNILRGLLPPTSGTIMLGGRRLKLSSPQVAQRAGIGMVHQHFLLVPTFTVAESLALASSEKHPPLKKAAEAAARLGWSIPMNAKIADLPVGTQQRVEILKALLGDAKILLFDEPTAVLAPSEIEELFAVLRSLRAEGRSLIFVSHKLNEVMALCDRVSVLRRGRLVGTVAVDETSPEDLAQRMVGDSTFSSTFSSTFFPSAAPSSGRPIEQQMELLLSVNHIHTGAQADAVALEDISFDLRPGETLGFAGVDGNGQAELAGVLTGMRPIRSGEIVLNGEPLLRFTPHDLERLGIALIPPDRHIQGLALTLSIADNLTFSAAFASEFRRGPFGAFFDRAKLTLFAHELARDFDIRAADLSLPAGSLSGGNQQKIVVARALCRQPPLLVAVSPTRGLDVAATRYVHTKLRQRQAAGGAMVLISTELDEVIALSSRIAVLFEGRVMGIVPPDTPREELGLLMGGKTLGGTEAGSRHG